MVHDHNKDVLEPKEARQGKGPNVMVWVLLISTVAAAVAMYLVLAIGWTDLIPG